jgi:hypothetical protein
LWKRDNPDIYWASSSGAQVEAKGKKEEKGFLGELERAEDAVLGKVAGLFRSQVASGAVSEKPREAAPPPSVGSETFKQPAQVQSTPVVASSPSQAVSDSAGAGLAPGVYLEDKTNVTPASSQTGGKSVTKREVLVPGQSIIQTKKEGFSVPEKQIYKEGETRSLGQTLVPQKTGLSIPAHFSSGAAPPIPPESPNILVGQVLDERGKIVEGAILEIRDYQGRPVRALKSARTGHFRIVTPLESGTYKILIEKEGLTFEPVEINVSGQIIQPIAIGASGKEEIQNGQSK